MPDGTQVQLDDFKRADRQQQVLLELRKEFAKMDLFFDLPDVLQAVGSTVQTDFPRDKAGDLASLLPLITGTDIRRVVLDLPRFVDPPLEPEVNYILMPRRDDVRAEMRRLFGRGNLEGWYLATRDEGRRTPSRATAPGVSGRGDWIRTSDLLLPKQVRYQAALRPDGDVPDRQNTAGAQGSTRSRMPRKERHGPTSAT